MTLETYMKLTLREGLHETNIACRVDKQGAHPPVSDQTGVKKLGTGSKTPVNNGQEASHTRP